MTAISRQQSLDQQRAAQAWTCVGAVREGKKEYLSLARSAPADIQTNGLGQAMAFWKAKGFKGGTAKPGDPHAELFKHVSGWVLPKVGTSDSRDLLEWVTTKATTNEYRRATVEAMAFLSWLKRFAEAELGDE